MGAHRRPFLIFLKVVLLHLQIKLPWSPYLPSPHSSLYSFLLSYLAASPRPPVLHLSTLGLSVILTQTRAECVGIKTSAAKSAAD